MSSPTKRKPKNNSKVTKRQLQNRANSNTNGVTGRTKKKSKNSVEALKKRMKIGKINNLKKTNDFKGSIEGNQISAFSISVGASKSYLYEDSGGKKLHISKIEKGKEGDIVNMVTAMTESNIKSKSTNSIEVDKTNPVVKISVDMNNVADLGLLNSELKKIGNNNVEFVAEGLNGRKFSDLKSYLETASGDRSDNESYNKIVSLLDRANQIDQQDSKTVANTNELLNISKTINELIPSAQSTKTFQKEKRNKALENLGFLLNREGPRLNMEKVQTQNGKMIALNRSEARKRGELPTAQPNNFALSDQQGAIDTFAVKTIDGTQTIATFKPESQELRAATGEGIRGEGAIREVVGFELAKQQGLNVVPDTRLAAFTNEAFSKNGNTAIPDSASDKQVGSLQAIPDNSDGNLAAYLSDPQKNKINFDQQSLQEMAILDIITLNTGRKAEDIILDTTGKLHAVNQGNMVPDVNRFKENFENDTEVTGFAWADLPESNNPFSAVMVTKILQMDVDQIVDSMKQQAEEASKKLAAVTGEDPKAIEFTPDQLDMMRFSGRALKLAVAAGLSPAQIESMFKKRTAANTRDADPNNKITAVQPGGGEFADFLNATFLKNDQEREAALQQGLPLPERAVDFAKSEEEFREQMSFALARLGVDMNTLQVPNDVFSRPKLNAPGVQAVPAQNGNQPPRPTGLLDRYKQYRQRVKDKKVVGNIIDLNTVTASDVYSVKTKGSIDKIGTNEGFAKKGAKKDEEANPGAFVLIGQENLKEKNGKFLYKENPNLIARQVISSRLDRTIGLNVLAREIFSKNIKTGVLGISARIPGKAIKEQGDPDNGLPDLYRNFDFTQPATQKGLSDLQIMDALTGQIDRHGGNIFIDPETGKVSGIDNDLAFPDSLSFNNQNEQKPRLNQLEKQFSKDAEGKYIYNQDLIDADTANKFLAIDRDELESILKGRISDPERLDKVGIQETLKRFDAIIAKINQLKDSRPPRDPNHTDRGNLVTDWTPGTFNEALGNNGSNDGSNYLARSVSEFVRAGDPTIGVLAQAL